MFQFSGNRQRLDLPCEIWLHIATFLPWPTVETLLSLNRAFFHHVLSTKYRAIHVGEFTNPGSWIPIERLKDPFPARYVRNLTLRPAMLLSIPSLLKPLPSSDGRLGANLWKKLKGPSSRSRRTAPGDRAMAREVLLEVMSNLTQVMVLTIECSKQETYDSRWDPRFAQILNVGWQSFSSTLETLVLNVPNDVLGGSNWIFPSQPLSRLRTMELQLTTYGPQLEGRQKFHAPIIDKFLLPFLNANNHISSFAVTIVSNCPDVQLHLFKGLSKFPSLSKLEVACYCVPHQDSAYDAIATFALTRAPGLQELRLEMDSQPLLASTLSNIMHGAAGNEDLKMSLRKLSIQHAINVMKEKTDKIFLSSDMQTTVFSASMAKPLSSLTELDMGNIVLSFSEFKDIIRLFESTTLSALHLSTKELGPEIFMVTSSVLPQLRVFTIRYLFLNIIRFSGPHEAELPRLPASKFIQDMQAHSFTNWSLEHLRIKPLWYWPWLSCKQAIASAFPNVKTFNGASREEYLSENNMDHI